MDLQFRIELLLKIKKIIKDHESEILEALRKDLGKSQLDAYMSEISFIYEEIDFTLKHIKEWAQPKKVSSPLILWPARSEIHSEPFGRVLIIAPWNYPFQLLFSPLIGAIAAGNSVVLKPSEISQNTEIVIEKIIRQNFDNEIIQVVTGGSDFTEKLLNQRFDFIFFTGSTAVGKVIMKKAAVYLTPVCLELGGKSPAIIDKTANLEVAARRIVWGKFFNAGQTCVAPDYICVEESIRTDFVTLLKKNIRDFYGENEKNSKDYGRIVSKRHFDRLCSLMSVEKVLYGGQTDEDSLFISPTLVDVENFQNPIMQEEIFGPILPIMTYKTADEVIQALRTQEKPLALYVFTESKSFSERVIRELSFGGGCINDCIMHLVNPQLPFGGVGNSGMGNYHGKFSFETFSHKKSILRKTSFLDFKFRYPPYDDKKISTLKRFLK